MMRTCDPPWCVYYVMFYVLKDDTVGMCIICCIIHL